MAKDRDVRRLEAARVQVAGSALAVLSAVAEHGDLAPLEHAAGTVPAILETDVSHDADVRGQRFTRRDHLTMPTLLKVGPSSVKHMVIEGQVRHGKAIDWHLGLGWFGRVLCVDAEHPNRL